MSIDYLADNLTSTAQINALPESLAVQLLFVILSKGNLNVEIGRMFQRCRHRVLSDWVSNSVDFSAAAMPMVGACRPSKY